MALIEHRKAKFEYEILEKLDAGIQLLGFEVKMLKNKQGSLEGSRVIVRGGEAYIVGMTIPPYQPNNTPKDYDPMRNRKLLLTKAQIARISSFESKKGLTIVPISVYNHQRKVKVDVAVVRGLKKYDKREVIRKRDTEREIRRTLKNE